jgi:hypothetical protein
MSVEQDIKYSYFLFFSSIVFAGLLIYVLIYGTGISRVVAALLICNLIYRQLKIALFLYRSAKEKK